MRVELKSNSVICTKLIQKIVYRAMKQIKKHFAFAILLLLVCSVWIYSVRQKSFSFPLSDYTLLLKDNIEALTQSEDDGSICYSIGTIDCKGVKVKFIFKGTR